MRKTALQISLILTVLVLSVAFQNCAKQPVLGQSKSLSSMCIQAVQASFKTVMANFLPPDCENAASYSCEKRVFSPQVHTSSETSKECLQLNGSGICLDLVVRNYDTSAARNTADAKSFEEGGDYNHTEVNCFHKSYYRGVATIRADADNLQEAFVLAQKKCQSALPEAAQ